MGGPEAETPAVVVDTPVEPLNEEVVKKTKEAAKDANGNVEETNGEGKDANGNVEEAKEARDETGEKQTKTVLSVVTKLKEDTKLSDRWVLHPHRRAISINAMKLDKNAEYAT